MNDAPASFSEPAEELFDNAPCGWLFTDPGGTIIRANRTLQSWLGDGARDLLVGRRFQDLLAPGDRIFHQTNIDPLLRVQGSVSQVALELTRADGTRLPALVNSVLRRDAAGEVIVISTMVFDASDRRRYERQLLHSQRQEREIAHALQRSMMSGTLPDGPGFSLEVVYLPAVAGLQVGGDWYDAFWLDDRHETVGLVVGDVVGRGLEAAAAMAQLRSAIRAVAVPGVGCGAVLDALDLYARRHQIGHCATVVVAQLDLNSGELQFACAGHPPPVIVASDGQAYVLWGGRTSPLDASPADAPPRREGRHVMTAGSTLLLYTDGLIERPSHPEEDGLQRLLDAIVAHGDHLSGAGIGQTVVRSLRDAEPIDDVCLLAAELLTTRR